MDLAVAAAFDDRFSKLEQTSSRAAGALDGIERDLRFPEVAGEVTVGVERSSE